MKLKHIRVLYNLTQQQAANIVGMPLRTYVRYEKDEEYGDKIKRAKIEELLEDQCAITESKGVLPINAIIQTVSEVIDNNYKGKIEYCYLFGSYAKGYAKGDSDVDLCIATEITGFEYYGLAESLRESLHKKVDLIRINDLKNNLELIMEIMKDGIKVYG